MLSTMMGRRRREDVAVLVAWSKESFAKLAEGAQNHLDVANGDRSKVPWRCCGPCGMEASGSAMVSPDISLGPLGGCMPRP